MSGRHHPIQSLPKGFGYQAYLVHRESAVRHQMDDSTERAEVDPEIAEIAETQMMYSEQSLIGRV